MLEVCVDTIESVRAAVDGGAARIELCSALSEGGLTPTLGMLKVVKREVNAVAFRTYMNDSETFTPHQTVAIRTTVSERARLLHVASARRQRFLLHATRNGLPSRRSAVIRPERC